MIKSEYVRKYYLKLEIFYSYLEYVNNYRVKLKELEYKNQLKQNESELDKKKLELEEAKRCNSNLTNFINDVKSKHEKGFIYIATSENYSSQNVFKIGQTTNSSSRLSVITPEKQKAISSSSVFTKGSSIPLKLSPYCSMY